MQFGIGSLSVLAFRLLALVVVSTATVWLPWFKGSEHLSIAHWVAAVVLAIFVVTAWFIDRFVSRRKAIKLTEKLSETESVKLAFVLNRLSGLTVVNASSTDIEMLCTRILECMELRVRLYLRREDKDYFNVSFLVFHGNDGKKLDIKARSNLKRKLGTNIDASQSAAYYIAKFNKVRAIHDFSQNNIFPARGLSEDTLPYRSILLLPCTPDHPCDDGRCKAVVSIDSEKPYEFWGVATTDLQTQMRPYLNLLSMMLARHSYGVPTR